MTSQENNFATSHTRFTSILQRVSLDHYLPHNFNHRPNYGFVFVCHA